MDAMDRELRALLDDASGSPSLSRHDELLETLVARVDAGGTDVADAPSPSVQLEPVAGEVSVATPARKAARAAGAGIGGWVALGVATAAAAAGAWLLEGQIFDREPGSGATDPVTTVEVGAPLNADVDIIVEPIRADVSPSAGTREVEEESAPAPVEVVANDDTTAGDSGTDAHDLQGESLGGGNGDGSGAPSGAVQSAPGEDFTEGGTDGLAQRLGDGLGKGIGEVEGGVKDVVDGLLPEGPVADTVRPVIHAVDVEGLTQWLVSSLLCRDAAPVAVNVTDDVGVETVTLDVTTGLGINASVPLSQGPGSTWTGTLAPVAALDLGLLDPVINVQITARDAAGNTATASESVRASVLPCLG